MAAGSGVTRPELPPRGREDYDADLVQVGLWLRDRRREYGLRQRALAELLDVPQSRISDWETGKMLPMRAMSRAVAFFGGMITIDVVDLR